MFRHMDFCRVLASAPYHHTMLIMRAQSEFTRTQEGWWICCFGPWAVFPSISDSDGHYRYSSGVVTSSVEVRSLSSVVCCTKYLTVGVFILSNGTRFLDFPSV